MVQLITHDVRVHEFRLKGQNSFNTTGSVIFRDGVDVNIYIKVERTVKRMQSLLRTCLLASKRTHMQAPAIINSFHTTVICNSPPGHVGRDANVAVVRFVLA